MLAEQVYPISTFCEKISAPVENRGATSVRGQGARSHPRAKGFLMIDIYTAALNLHRQNAKVPPLTIKRAGGKGFLVGLALFCGVYASLSLVSNKGHFVPWNDTNTPSTSGFDHPSGAEMRVIRLSRQAD